MHTVDEIASNACWFPVSIDPSTEEIRFVHTSSRKLESCAFHDGRTEFGVNGRTATIDLDEALQWHEKCRTAQTPLRIITHTSFCGSTLLARLLSLDTKSCSYREPQILAELSNLKSAGHALTQSAQRWADIIAFVFNQFTLHWPEHHAAIIKPSNWANKLMEDLDERSEIRRIQISSDIESYLCANLRGGRSRISYSLRLLNHLTSDNTSGRQAIAEIEEMKLPGTANILHLLALCLHVQESEFEKNKEHNCRVLELDKKDLMLNPGRTVDQSVKTLGIAKPYQTRDELHEVVHRNAKLDQRSAYSPTEEGLQNTWLKREYAAELQSASLWFREQKEKASSTYDDLSNRMH